MFPCNQEGYDISLCKDKLSMNICRIDFKAGTLELVYCSLSVIYLRVCQEISQTRSPKQLPIVHETKYTQYDTSNV